MMPYFDILMYLYFSIKERLQLTDKKQFAVFG